VTYKLYVIVCRNGRYKHGGYSEPEDAGRAAEFWNRMASCGPHTVEHCNPFTKNGRFRKFSKKG
jgi:hypothetical protein